jgi:hypothetical protein
MHRYALRDDQWDKIKDFLPGREGHVGGTAADNRLFVDAVIYRYRTGLPRGAIYLSATDIGRLFTDGTGDGAKVAFSCGFSRLCPGMPTTSS